MNAFWLLLAAHVLGDFVFQTATSVAEKHAKRHRSWRFWQHVAGHGVLAFLALAVHKSPPAVLVAGSLWIVATHGLIDWLKLTADRRFGPDSPWRFRSYLIDQALHVAALDALSQFLTPWPLALPSAESVAALLALLVLSTAGIGYGIDLYLTRFQMPTQDDGEGLPGAGFHIGMLERLLVVGFVLLDLPSGVGFLLAAKSIFRFGDLQRAESRQLTEYVLIGTLLSIGGAYLLAEVFRQVAPLLLETCC